MAKVGEPNLANYMVDTVYLLLLERVRDYVIKNWGGKIIRKGWKAHGGYQLKHGEGASEKNAHKTREM